MSTLIVEPDLSSIAFGNVAVDKRAAVLVKLHVVSFGFNGPVTLEVTPSVTSPDGGALLVFSDDWTPSGTAPVVYTHALTVTPTTDVFLDLPLVVLPLGVEPGDSISGNVRIAGGGSFPESLIPFTASVVASEEQSLAVHLVLDCSASMNAPLGGSTRTLIMRRACLRASALLGANDWLGVVRMLANFNELHKPEHFTGDRKDDIVERFSPTNNTYKPIATDPPAVLGLAIDRAELSLSLLCSCSPETTRRGIIVMTDGLATPPLPPSVKSYAIGIGLASQVDPVTLAACSSNGTFFLLDSMPEDGTEDAFLLDKYLIQAIAELADLPIVFDPHGALRKDDEISIPFHLTDLDSEARVMVLVDDAKLVDVDLHPAEKDDDDDGHHGHDDKATPLTRELRAAARPSDKPRKPRPCRKDAIDFSTARGASRVKTDGHVTLTVDRGRRADPSLRTSGEWQLKFRLSERAREEGRELARLRYSVVVLARSALKFTAQVTQEHYAIGATLFLTARVIEHGGPVTSRRVFVVAQVTFPDGSTGEIRLTESFAPGRFTGELRGTQPGVYRIRFRAHGVTQRQDRFHRELTYTALIERCSSPCAPRRQHIGALPPGVEVEPDADESGDDESSAHHG